MPTYKPLSGISKSQKFAPFAIIGCALPMVGYLIAAAMSITILINPDRISLDTESMANAIVNYSLLLHTLVCATWAALAVADTNDHDPEYNTPTLLPFITCFLPPIGLILPFVLINQVLGRCMFLTGTRFDAAMVKLWIWCGCYCTAFLVTMFSILEEVNSDVASTPVSDAIFSVLWAVGALFSIFAVADVSQAVAAARKKVLFWAAQQLAQQKNAPGQPNQGHPLTAHLPNLNTPPNQQNTHLRPPKS